MSGPRKNDGGPPASGWAREILDKAVGDLEALGIFADELVEARPVWSLPDKVMIGQIRVASEPGSFRWIICGDLPTDHISSSAAANAREAMRHFSLKWQLDAARYEDPATRKQHGLDESKDWAGMTRQLVAKAEELYAIAENDGLWRAPG